MNGRNNLLLNDPMRGARGLCLLTKHEWLWRAAGMVGELVMWRPNSTAPRALDMVVVVEEVVGETGSEFIAETQRRS